MNVVIVSRSTVLCAQKKKKAKDSYRNTSTTEDMFSFLNTNVAEATISNRSRGIEEIPGAPAAGGRGGNGKAKTKKNKTEAELRLELVQKQRCDPLPTDTTNPPDISQAFQPSRFDLTLKFLHGAL